MVRAGASKRGITTPSLIIHSENSRQEMSTQHAISLDKLPPTSNALDLKHPRAVRPTYFIEAVINTQRTNTLNFEFFDAVFWKSTN